MIDEHTGAPAGISERAALDRSQTTPAKAPDRTGRHGRSPERDRQGPREDRPHTRRDLSRHSGRGVDPATSQSARFAAFPAAPVQVAEDADLCDVVESLPPITREAASVVLSVLRSRP